MRKQQPSPHRCLSAVFALAAVVMLLGVSGCGEPGQVALHGTVAPGKTMTLDLGDAVTLPLIWIDPLQMYVGKYEVTNEQFRRFFPGYSSGRHPSLGLDLDGFNQPVVNVSWDEAMAFCQGLTELYGVQGDRQYEFRLPTAREWEVFAACGQNIEYPWGPQWPPPKNWNYFGLENKGPGQKLDHNDGFVVSCPVNCSGENRWGLFGVGGNVWEWCHDAEGRSSARIFKGASYTDCHPYFLALLRRSSAAPDARNINRGFRVIAVPLGEGKQPELQFNW